MVWRTLINTLFPGEFAIDEQPLAVHREAEWMRPDHEVAVAIEAGPPAEDAESAAPTQPAHASDGADLFSEVSQLLLEQVRLEQKALMLEADRSGGDDLDQFIRQLLPFLDNYWRLLELAREHPPSEEIRNWLGNLESLYFRIVRLLENHGLVFLNSVGKEVNLEIHEVVEYRTTTEHPHNHVIKELERGVVFRNRLLRDAKVVVACNPS